MRLHVFPFSRREGTPAADMPDQVPETVKSKRVRRLIEAGETLSAAYRERLLGTTATVLLEERLSSGQASGYTPQYVQVACDAGDAGQLALVRLTALTKEGMSGHVVELIG